jgi:hypothetical protein
MKRIAAILFVTMLSLATRRAREGGGALRKSDGAEAETMPATTTGGDEVELRGVTADQSQSEGCRRGDEAGLLSRPRK